MMHDATPSELLRIVTDHVDQTIVGKKEVVRLIFIALISGGHVLIEDVPGVGKTSLIATIAKSFDCSFHRVQFTPDVTPSDVVGFSMYNRKTGEFEFKQGAAFCQFFLADEINRTPPKTQSSLLEVMEEKQVSVDAVTYTLPEPFIVFATQNPVDHIGTFPLPEAQIDRFLIKIKMGYPTHQQEMEMLSIHQAVTSKKTVERIGSVEDLLRLQRQVDEIYISELIFDYIVTLMRKTRTHPQIVLGASPRVTIGLTKAAKAAALLEDRTYVIPDDVQQIFLPIVAHHLVLSPEAKFQQIAPEFILREILQEVVVPTL